GNERASEEGNPGQEKLIGIAAQPIAQLLKQARLAPDSCRKDFPSFPDQVVANVRFSLGNPRIPISSVLGFACQNKRLIRYLRLSQIGLGRDGSELAAIEIPALKVHLGVKTNRILAQSLV